MPVEKAEVERLRRLTRAQLEAISRDFMQPESVQRAARSVLGDLARQRLITAVRSFDDAVPVFVDLTRKLRAITEEARKDPVGDAVSQLTMTIRRFGEVFDKVDDVVHEPPPKAGQELPGEPSPEPDAEIEAGAHAGGQAVVTGAPPPPPDEQPERQPEPPPSEAPATAFANAPPPGAAMNSTRFSEIAPEYVATFQAASIRPERVSAVEHVRRKLMGFAEDYRSVESLTGVPWHLVGLIHGMESSFNFGTHLHNGDSLSHRTRRVPAGRPAADVADPPFAWSTSAMDALTRGAHKLNLVDDWSLARQLYELERYNGFGYRFRGIATPYLWSGSDRYLKGRFVRDGVFDPDAVSAQVGAGVVLKAMQQAGDL